VVFKSQWPEYEIQIESEPSREERDAYTIENTPVKFQNQALDKGEYSSKLYSSILAEGSNS
jgi:hypothetical protein